MPDPTMTEPDAPPLTLTTARTTAEIAEALALYEWYEAHGDADCPPEAVPSEGDLAAWLPDCPAVVRYEVQTRFDAVLAAAPQSWPEDITPPPLRQPDPPTTGGWKVPYLSPEMLQALAAHLEVSTFQMGEKRITVFQEEASPAASMGPRQSPAIEAELLEQFFRPWISDPATQGDGKKLLGCELLHALWLAIPSIDRPSHPFAPLVRTWQERPVIVEPFHPTRRASLPRLHRIQHDAAADRLPGFPVANAPARQFDLPGFKPEIDSCPSWMLWMFDHAGGESMAQGRGAPWPMRLFVGSMLHLPVPQRTGAWHILRFPTDEVIRWLHPDGWSNRRRDWERFPAALDAMMQRLAYVPVPGIGSVAMLFPSVIPRVPTDPFVEFTIRIPSAAAHGARIDWPILCRYGTESAALYRAYLSSIAYMDRSAHHGHAITAEIGTPLMLQNGRPKRRKGGAIVRSAHETMPNPAAQYVAPLTDADLARMIGFDGNDKRRRHDARRAFERLVTDGIIDLQRDNKNFRLFRPNVH